MTISDPTHLADTHTPYNSPREQLSELPHNSSRTSRDSPNPPPLMRPDPNRRVNSPPEGFPAGIILTAQLDHNIILNWWAAYNVYVLQYQSITTFENAIISDWQQHFPTMAPHLTHNELGKVLLAC